MIKFYRFGFGEADGDGSMKELLGGKGAGLAEMSMMGLPVPPGFTIPTTACVEYMKGSGSDREAMLYLFAQDALCEIARLENKLGRRVLVSVRSGARVSMPGMMDTILNVGLTGENFNEFVDLLGTKAAADCATRLEQMYTTTCGVEVVPGTPVEQLRGAIKAVFESWNSERAIAYRDENNIPNEWGTAVTIQVMVYGNLNEDSCSGVLFTRDPMNGENVIVGEYLPNAQGEDVVAGTHTPISLFKLPEWDLAASTVLFEAVAKLEAHYRDMQDVEFTVEDGKVYLLQTRSAKRSALAAFRVARDMVNEGRITKAEAVKRVTAKQYMALKTPVIDPEFKTPPTATGTPASAGLVTGVAVFTNAEAKAIKVPCILVAEETTPDDYPGMLASVGVLTFRGGATSHAAVVARGMDKACIVGIGALSIASGDKVTLDGATGRVWVNVDVPVSVGGSDPAVAEVVAWAVELGDVVVKHKITPDVELPKAGRIVADVSQYASEGTCFLISKVFKNLKATELGGIITFMPPPMTADKGDEIFLSWIGLGAPVQAEDTASPAIQKAWRPKLKILRSSAWSSKFKSRWVLELPEWLSDEDRASVLASGWYVVSYAKSLQQLLDVSGVVVPSEELKKVLGTNYEKIVVLLKKAGRKADSLPKIVSPEDVVFEVFAK